MADRIRASIPLLTPAGARESSGGLLPGARRHQLLGSVLEALVQRLDRLERVDLVGRLVGSQVRDPREAEGEARLMPARPDDDVEGDLDDDRRLDLAVAAVAGDRVVLEPGGH